MRCEMVSLREGRPSTLKFLPLINTDDTDQRRSVEISWISEISGEVFMGLMTGGKGGGNKSLASKPNLLSALRVQTSSYGQVLPIVYGQNRISGRLIWSGDFAYVHAKGRRQGHGNWRRQCRHEHDVHIPDGCGHRTLPGADSEHSQCMGFAWQADDDQLVGAIYGARRRRDLSCGSAGRGDLSFRTRGKP